MKTGLMQPESTVGSKGFYRDQAFEANLQPARVHHAVRVARAFIATKRLKHRGLSGQVSP